VGNDLRTEQANRLQHVPLLVHGWPKQDMRDAQTLHVLEIGGYTLPDRTISDSCIFLGTITAIPFVEQSLCFLTRGLGRGPEIEYRAAEWSRSPGRCGHIPARPTDRNAAFPSTRPGVQRANHPGISHASRALDGRVSTRANPHWQGLLAAASVDRDSVKIKMLAMVLTHSLSVTQATHDFKRLDKTGHAHLLRSLKGLVCLWLVFPGNRSGGAPTAHHIQHGNLLRQ